MVSDVIGIGKVVEPLAKATSELILAFLKSGTEEVGGWVADRVRISRQRNVEKVLSKAKAHLDADGIAIKPVAAKTLFAIAEACSLEDDDEMIERWANLLAAAATDDSVLPSYVDALSKLSPAEAKVLDAIQKVHKHVRASESLGVGKYWQQTWRTFCAGQDFRLANFIASLPVCSALAFCANAFNFGCLPCLDRTRASSLA